MTWYNNLTSDARENVGNWTKWKNYVQWNTDSNPKTQVLIHLDAGNQSDHLVMSNLITIEKALEKEDPDNYESITETHWAVGTISGVMITAIDDNGNETRAWQLIVDFARALSNYPVLDENDFSEREYDQLMADLESILNDTGFGFIAAYQISERFETGVYPDTDEVVKHVTELIESNIDDTSAETMAALVTNYDDSFSTSTLSTKQISNALEYMDTDELKTILTAVKKQLGYKP